MVSIFQSVTGVFVENTYFLVNKKEKWGIIIDPGQGAFRHLEQLNMKDISWKAIFITHAHFDHILGLYKVNDKTNAPIYLHKEDLFIYNRFEKEVTKFGYTAKRLPLPNFFWKDKDVISIGTANFEIIHTPGHTPGSVCIKLENRLFTGDTLMHKTIGKIGKYGSLNDIKKSVFEKLFTLSDDTIIYPGHQKISTIKEEKIHNSKLFLNESIIRSS